MLATKNIWWKIIYFFLKYVIRSIILVIHMHCGKYKNYKVNILLNGMSCYTISTIWIWMLLLDLLLYLMMGGLGGSWPAAGWRHFLLQVLAIITMKKMMMRVTPNDIYKNRNLLYFIHSTIVVIILPTMYPLIQRQSDVGSRLMVTQLKHLLFYFSYFSSHFSD